MNSFTVDFFGRSGFKRLSNPNSTLSVATRHQVSVFRLSARPAPFRHAQPTGYEGFDACCAARPCELRVLFSPFSEVARFLSCLGITIKKIWKTKRRTCQNDLINFLRDSMSARQSLNVSIILRRVRDHRPKFHAKFL